jgi:hypothetical protein
VASAEGLASAEDMTGDGRSDVQRYFGLVAGVASVAGGSVCPAGPRVWPGRGLDCPVPPGWRALKL